jgi:hypothetical protein
LLANIFLHYVLDLWVHQWRRRNARGQVTIVRYADDFVMGFEKADDARRMMRDLKERLARFGLQLHEEKTRLIEFGRFASSTRKARGDQRPETFAFLGFTHYCGWTRDGRFLLKHKYAEHPPDAQAYGDPAGGAATHASALGSSAPLVRQRAARPLRLLRHAAQLAISQRLPARHPANLVQLPETAKPEEPPNGL